MATSLNMKTVANRLFRGDFSAMSWNKLDNAAMTKLLRMADNDGYTIAHAVAYSGHLDQVPAAAITTEVLRIAENNKWTVAHSAALNGHLDQIPAAAITNEVLRAADNNQVTVIHVAAVNGHLDQIPAILLTRNILTLKDASGVTVIKVAANMRGQLSAIFSRIPPKMSADIAKLCIIELDRPDCSI